jgi:uncharacterized protein YrrD
MQDLGAPSSYLELRPGAPCYSCDGEQVGAVERVLAAPEEDIFDGVIIRTGALSGRERFCEAAQVEEIFERGVLLKLDRAGVDELPEAR